MKKAMDRYIAVLENDEANSFATLGIANVLAEHGKQNEAFEIYKVLALSNPNMHHPLVNQAHLLMAQNNFSAAANLYKQCLEKFFENGRNLEIELFLSKAYYQMGQFVQCKKVLFSLLARYPSEFRIKLNIALCLWQQATEAFNRNYRKVSETHEAISFLKHSEKLFNSIMRSESTFLNHYQSNISKEQRELEKIDF